MERVDIALPRRVPGKVKEAPPLPSAMATGPAHVLEQVLHQKVSLVLKDGRTISGELLGVDEHLNLVLDHSEETTSERTRRLGRLIVRGSSVTSLFAPGRIPAKVP